MRRSSESRDRLAPAPEAAKSSRKKTRADGQPYLIEDGCLCWRKPGPEGAQLVKLAQFTAKITGDILWDDGVTQHRRLRLEGQLPNGSRLGPSEISSQRFSTMRWIGDQWGPECYVEPGSAKLDHLRAAIQYLSRGQISRVHQYAHTGWCELAGQRFFCHAGGALGHDDVSTEMVGELDRYILPSQPANVPEAMANSLQMMAVAPEPVMIPLWASMYLAPLSEIIPPAYTLWISGESGVKKSTLAALALCHYGAFTNRTLPTDWSGSGVALTKLLFMAKDLPMVIDEFILPQSLGARKKMLEAAEMVDRAQANRSGRLRLQADTRFRPTYRPRGLAISTGELTPEGYSHMARLFVVHVARDCVNMDRLTQAQGEAWSYPRAMAGYILWLRDHWPRLQRELPELWTGTRQAMLRKDMHDRISEAIASLYVGCHVATEFAQTQGVLAPDQVVSLRLRALDVLLDDGLHQAAMVSEQRPAEQFIRAIRSGLDQGRVSLLPKGQDPPEGGSREVLGWQDELWVHLLPDPCYIYVTRWLQAQGVTLATNMRALGQQLREGGLLHGCEDGRTTSVVWAGTRARRVWTLPASALVEQSPIESFPS